MRITGLLPDSFLRCMSAEDRRSYASGQLTLEEAAAKAAAKSERELQGWLVGWLRIKGFEVLWHRTDKRSAATIGWPDLTFSVGGLAVAWEVKLPGEQPTKEQEHLHRRMEENGWIVRVIQSMRDGQEELLALCKLTDMMDNPDWHKFCSKLRHELHIK